MKDVSFEGQVGSAMSPKIANLFYRNSEAWEIIMLGYASLPKEQGPVWIKDTENDIADLKAKQEKAIGKTPSQNKELQGNTVGTISPNILKIFRENAETWEYIIEGHASLSKEQGLLWLSNKVNDINSRQKAIGSGRKKP